jgi:hypothetical protein
MKATGEKNKMKKNKKKNESKRNEKTDSPDRLPYY